MLLLKQLIILNRQGKGIKTIAQMLGMSEEMVEAYLYKLPADKGGISSDALHSPGQFSGKYVTVLESTCRGGCSSKR